MKKNIFNGIFPALITPFSENGKLKENSLREIIRFLIDVQKVDGLYVTGSTGEFLLLSHDQKKRILEIVAEEAKGKITLIAQIGNLNLSEVKSLARHAEKLKYDAISAITPYYYNFSFEEVKSYYNEISQASNLPMFIYYLPQLAGGKVSLEQFSELLNIKNVIGSKYGSTDLFFFERLINKCKDKIFMFAYDEALGLGLSLGARGFIGSTYNINTKGAREIITAYEKNDQIKFKESIHKYNDYIQQVLKVGLMQTLKAVMREKGVDAGYNKKPFKFISKEDLKPIAQELIKKYNL
ncbi:N-acetylneuraminate lyase [Mesomycoplasma neurolyticum]|uniref:N-acetylneuraminate lyase n=1 Tax=Mesomycoplasma neurolyticum TaxID=2120 RepID=A0A449A4Y4_9BACT|nr:N-acetylneuraminate lyase [Mesomycoplasma neurolyticum]VEU59289.1 N-acetylneuraminate lyase [Mesomycoplasma neurolyticum]